MNNATIITVDDWSPIKQLKYSEKLFCYKSVNTVDCENLGIYLDDRNQYRSSGYVGVCVLQGKDGQDYIGPDGKKIILYVKPRFKTLSPWQMLTEIMQDEEYEDYIHGSENTIYTILDAETPIKLNIDESGGEVLLAISFIRCCYKICSTNLKRQMSYKTENLNGKIRGRIDFPNQVKKNISRGREDQIYCKYPAFSENILENKILKMALIVSERILRVNKCMEADGIDNVRSMFSYCRNRLKMIDECAIRKSDFAAINVKGFNASYGPAIKLAEMLLSHSNMSVNTRGAKSGYVIPYAIRMEALFEFYTRTKIKEHIKNENLQKSVRLDAYRSNKKNEDVLLTIQSDSAYLMKNYIPDIAFQINLNDGNSKEEDWKYVAVMDVKYQKSTEKVGAEARRHNSHQLLFYALLLNVKRCGFVFPKDSEKNSENNDENGKNLVLQEGNADGSERLYSEFHFGEDEKQQKSEIDRLLAYAIKGEKMIKDVKKDE